MTNILTLKQRKLLVTGLFCLAGAGYFVTFSKLESVFFLRGYVAIIPLQLLALLYVFYGRWNKR